MAFSNTLFVLFVSFLTFCGADQTLIEKELTGRTVYISKIKLNWNDAFDYCIRNGLTFAKIKSAEENTELSEKLKTVIRTEEFQVWIGGIEHHQDSSFRWVSDSQPITNKLGYKYTNWNTGEPTNYQNNEYCLEILFRKEDGKWNDFPCSARHHFVCEKRTK
ncbi:C-type lectin mannose-binding isoform-like [Lutzomyia longipalpis]|uniref:16.6 kDa salivary protein n=1 Tax=Lutzomyia longipalpis TaxID=7200 RepID=Q07CZ8_LUTLO|nr:C-type lectin mannose-binding isoform-like [Lutzomyia longipalpis]ABB00903.1 16.6 kDa salivary protein [Lutzomyia longipalpis]